MTVPGLPIIVDAADKDSAVALVKEVIALYREEHGTADQTVRLEIVAIDA